MPKIGVPLILLLLWPCSATSSTSAIATADPTSIYQYMDDIDSGMHDDYYSAVMRGAAAEEAMEKESDHSVVTAPMRRRRNLGELANDL